MALVQAVTLEVPDSASAGTPSDVSMYDRKAVFVDGTFVATVQIQISPDKSGVRWFNEGAAFTGAGVIEITKPCRRVRANVTAYTSGAPAATLTGVIQPG